MFFKNFKVKNWILLNCTYILSITIGGFTSATISISWTSKGMRTVFTTLMSKKYALNRIKIVKGQDLLLSNELWRVNVTPLFSNKLENNFFNNNLFCRCQNLSNAVRYNRVLVILYASKILARYCQPMLWNLKIKNFGARTPPPSIAIGLRVNRKSLMVNVNKTAGIIISLAFSSHITYIS